MKVHYLRPIDKDHSLVIDAANDWTHVVKVGDSFQKPLLSFSCDNRILIGDEVIGEIRWRSPYLIAISRKFDIDVIVPQEHSESHIDLEIAFAKRWLALMNYPMGAKGPD